MEFLHVKMVDRVLIFLMDIHALVMGVLKALPVRHQ